MSGCEENEGKWGRVLSRQVDISDCKPTTIISDIQITFHIPFPGFWPSLFILIADKTGYTNIIFLWPVSPCQNLYRLNSAECLISDGLSGEAELRCVIIMFPNGSLCLSDKWNAVTLATWLIPAFHIQQTVTRRF